MLAQMRVLNIKDFILIWYNSSVYGGGYVMEAIKVSHLTFSYDGKNDILKDVNISLNKPIFISRNKTKYEEITYNELVDLINKV